MTHDESAKEAGVKAILILEHMTGLETTESEAISMWDEMSSWERQVTMDAYDELVTQAQDIQERLFSPGCRVRLNGDFLRNTGQVAGGEGTKVWTVVPCICNLCRTCEYVAVDEDASIHEWSVLKGPRHIHIKNLESAP